MSGAIIFRSGGPITWKTKRQERTSLSSCNAEICATAMGSRLIINTRNLILHLKSLGYPIDDTDMATPLYNDNDACVKQCHNLTTKGNRHIEHRKNVTQEWVKDGSISVSHVNGKCNPSDIFTKEMHDSANFRCLQDSFMSRASNFFCGIFNFLYPLSTATSEYVAQHAKYVTPSHPGILDVLISQPSFCTPVSISCLTQSGQYILLCVTNNLSLQAPISNPMGGVTV